IFLLLVCLAALLSTTALAATTLTVGGSTTLTASNPSASYSVYGSIDYTYVWTTDSSSIASVSGNGKSATVTGKSVGPTTIYCTVSMSYESYDTSLETKIPRYDI
ncbi:MAG: hypothetical protein LUF68_03625, partial [Clostridiales bacterium]|nr:hypothetical protein [Clostridiales bacterium]